jgi:hypothetical protein
MPQGARLDGGTVARRDRDLRNNIKECTPALYLLGRAGRPTGTILNMDLETLPFIRAIQLSKTVI